ncbi:hypothetical protein FNF31_04156 [Cafeteria roenbergensis]|uniref:Uncharacterized protein n=1 Tax=Cafeteria roenbergensis TaxID=33653 RepID=A0A5A8D5Q8_CAFRO|nr:hypothetical protein FNF31_04156 [Cafeteria roenbergensis]
MAATLVQIVTCPCAVCGAACSWTCKQCDGITEVCRSMTRNPMCLCTAAMALLAPVPAVATMVIASMDLAAGSPCAAPQAEWVVVQAVVLLLHMAYAVYACCSFARPYVGAPPPPGLEVASEQARRNRDESQADRMRYLVCYDPVTAVYILLGGLFGAVWLILSPVWFGDAASLAGCPAETLSARQWAEGRGGQGSDVPPHKRAPAAATKAGATAPAEPPEAEAEPGAGAGAGAAAGPADAEAGGAATRVGHALGALVGGVVGFMAPKKPR